MSPETVTFKQARERIMKCVEPLHVESIALTHAAGRVLACEVKAPWGMPLWDNSAMDGFAVGKDVCDAEGEVNLSIRGYIPAGKTADGISLARGDAVKIMTGAPLPEGSAAIIPIENTKENGGEVSVKGGVGLGDHIRYKGEDISQGEVVLSPGSPLRPPQISMLASFGMLSIPVFKKPTVAILSTGDELVEPGESPKPGQIVDSNSYALAAAVSELGGNPWVLGSARDEPEELQEKVTQGLSADALISSAGISVGDRDFVQEMLLQMGVELIFGGVKVKPGRPTTFGIHQAKPVFSLPGNPVSSLLIFEQLVRPGLLRMMGYQELLKPLVKAQLAEVIRKKPGNVQLFRLKLQWQAGRWLATSAGDQNTGILKTLVNANGVAILPPEKETFSVGEEIDVHIF